MLDAEQLKSLKKGIAIVLGLVLLYYLSPILTFMQTHVGRKFTIYLTEVPKTYKAAKGINLADFQLEKNAFIRETDISGYDFENGVIFLDPEKKIFDSVTYLNLIGRVFVVCLGKERLYYGTFWTYKIAHGTDSIIAIPDQRGLKLEPGYFGIDQKLNDLIHDEKIRRRFSTVHKLR